MKFGMRFLALAVLIVATAYAQDVSGSIAGTVTDASGGGVPNAKVTVTNTDRNAVIRTVTTDASGNYSAPLLPIGTYAVAVEANGFRAVNRININLNVGDKLHGQHPARGGPTYRKSYGGGISGSGGTAERRRGEPDHGQTDPRAVPEPATTNSWWR